MGTTRDLFYLLLTNELHAPHAELFYLIAITKLNFFILYSKFFVRHFDFAIFGFLSPCRKSLELSDKHLLNNKNKGR